MLSFPFIAMSKIITSIDTFLHHPKPYLTSPPPFLAPALSCESKMLGHWGRAVLLYPYISWCLSFIHISIVIGGKSEMLYHSALNNLSVPMALLWCFTKNHKILHCCKLLQRIRQGLTKYLQSFSGCLSTITKYLQGFLWVFNPITH